MRTITLLLSILVIIGCNRQRNNKPQGQVTIVEDFTKEISTTSIDQEKNYERTAIDTTANPKANRLIRLFHKIQSFDSLNRNKFERQFFNEFPSDFESYRNLFGYIEEESMPLYYRMDMVMLFYGLTSIDKETLYNKYFDIAENGIWEADNIQDFVIGSKLKTDAKSLCDILSKRSDEKIKKHPTLCLRWPHPDDPQAMKRYQQGLDSVKKVNKRIARLMEETYKDLLSNMDDHGH